MRFVLNLLQLALAAVLLFILLGAAQPFERVPAGTEAYEHLAVIDNAGLLGDMELPAGELSRLEAAVVIQRALNEYGATTLSGAVASVETEAALGWLLGEFADELAQLGTPVNLSQSTGSTYSELEQRVSYLEDEAGDDGYEWEPGETYLDQLYACECEEEEEDGIDVNLYGDFSLQAQANSTSYVASGSESSESSDLSLYWGELGVDATDGTWSGHFSVLFDDVDEDIDAYEYYGRYDHPHSDYFLLAGRTELPFGNNDWYFPTDPIVNELGCVTAKTIGMGWDAPSWGFSAWLYNPEVNVGDEEDKFTDYSFVWDITRREADECQDGWQLTTGYISHVADHDLRIAGDAVSERNGAMNVFGRYDWGGNRYHFLVDWTHTLEEFETVDLDANGDGEGDQPCAINTEFVYEPCPDNLWGVSYQHACEVASCAKDRYGVLYGKRLSELAMLKLAYNHSKYNEFAPDGEDTDDSLVAEINLSF
ncbi:hypothetical protein JW859_00240 [bacterium]|nr:hypothetical protein [bacterium]